MKKVLLIILTLFCFSVNTKALCYDEDLNNWAVGAEVKFIDFDRNLINEETGEELGETMLYSHILALNCTRDDIIMKATNSIGKELEGMYIPGHKVYGIADFTHVNGVVYEISIYGSKDSACPNELLKTIKYEIEPYNFYYKTEDCENYPDAPNCEIYKDTSDLSEEEFEESMEEYIQTVEPKKDGIFTLIFKFMINYGIYILIPIIFISIFYLIKINKIRREERNK